jgi:hypothetical protein
MVLPFLLVAAIWLFGDWRLAHQLASVSAMGFAIAQIPWALRRRSGLGVGLAAVVAAMLTGLAAWAVIARLESYRDLPLLAAASEGVLLAMVLGKSRVGDRR